MSFDLVIFTVATGFDTRLAINTVRLPLYRALAGQLRGQGKVLVVTQPITPRPNPFEGVSGTLARLGRPRLERQEDNLFSFSPVLPAPLGALRRVPAAFKVVRGLLAREVRGAISRVRMNNPSRVLTVNDPFHYHLLGIAGETVAAYDCIDDYPVQFAGGWEADPEVSMRETRLVSQVDLVFTTSRALNSKMGGMHRSVHYVPNGVEFEFFHRALLDSTPIAPPLTRLPRPVVGFMGNLCSWYDFALLRAVIEARPAWSFVFIGWADAVSPADPLRRLTNVHFLGRQEYEDLPCFLKGFNVAVMPYQVSPAAVAVNPDKMYQYMAAGIPMVSTPIPEACQFSGVIEIASDTGAFLRAMGRCIYEDQRQKVARQVAVARNETWDRRAAAHIQAITEALSARQRQHEPATV